MSVVSSDKVDQFPLGLGITLDVALCGRRVRIPTHLLHVPEASAALDNPTGGTRINVLRPVCGEHLVSPRS